MVLLKKLYHVFLFRQVFWWEGINKPPFLLIQLFEELFLPHIEGTAGFVIGSIPLVSVVEAPSSCTPFNRSFKVQEKIVSGRLPAGCVSPPEGFLIMNWHQFTQFFHPGEVSAGYSLRFPRCLRISRQMRAMKSTPTSKKYLFNSSLLPGVPEAVTNLWGSIFLTSSLNSFNSKKLTNLSSLTSRSFAKSIYQFL